MCFGFVVHIVFSTFMGGILACLLAFFLAFLLSFLPFLLCFVLLCFALLCLLENPRESSCSTSACLLSSFLDCPSYMPAFLLETRVKVYVPRLMGLALLRLLRRGHRHIEARRRCFFLDAEPFPSPHWQDPSGIRSDTVPASEPACAACEICP